VSEFRYFVLLSDGTKAGGGFYRRPGSIKDALDEAVENCSSILARCRTKRGNPDLTVTLIGVQELDDFGKEIDNLVVKVHIRHDCALPMS
jgi:hypothetical protein